jgi:PilZ domain
VSALIPGTREVTHLVLTDGAVPYLLARVRWPDVAQATTVGNRGWLDDPGLFDLPYNPDAVPVTFAQAASVAAGWGMQLSAEAVHDAPSFIRRMPASWSDLSPAERRAFGIEFVGTKRASARSARRLRAYRAKAGAEAVPHVNGYARALAGAHVPPGDHAQATSTAILATAATSRIDAAAERRRHVRVRVDGRAHIRCGPTTISADLVDLSEGGMRCVQPKSPPLATGVTVDGPILLEASATASRICLNVAGRIAWHRSVGASTQFGIGFEQLTRSETEGLQWFLGVVCSKRGSR